jgi:hypothetical protein
MAFNDGQGGRGWTLVESTAHAGGPSNLASGPVTPGTAAFMPVNAMKMLAGISHQVMVRSAGSTTRWISSMSDSTPIQNLRNAALLNSGIPAGDATAAGASWTGPFSPSQSATNILAYSSSIAASMGYPDIYWAAGNAGLKCDDPTASTPTDGAGGLHLVGASSRLQFGNGSGCANEALEVLVR